MVVLVGSLLIMVGSSVGTAVPATATDPQPDLMEVSRELADAADRLADLQAQVTQAQVRAAESEAASAAATKRHQDLVVAVGLAQARIEVTESQLRTLTVEAERTRNRLSSLLREPYVAPEVEALRVLFAAQDVGAYSDGLMFARIARRVQDDELRRSAEQRSALRAQVVRLQAQRGEVESLVTTARAQVALTAQAEVAARAAQAELENLVINQQATVTAFEAAVHEEERRLAELSASSSALADRLVSVAELDALQEGSAEFVSMSLPVDGRVSSPFGYRIHPVLNIRKLHTGIDFAAPCGTPVRAAANGIVVSAESAGGYGNQLVLSHGRIGGVSVATTYNHLVSFAVTSGSVARGQVVAYVGTTGMSTGCHLHFETREGGTPVDPDSWLS